MSPNQINRGDRKVEGMNWYLEALKKYAVFSGRARRKEYWYFILFSVIMIIPLTVIDSVTGTFNAKFGTGLLGAIYIVAMWLPMIAVTVRRLHDTGRTDRRLRIGLVPLIGFVVLFIFTVQDSDPGENRFGSNPKATPGTSGRADCSESAIEKIHREADAHAAKKSRTVPVHPISEDIQKKQEFIALLKSAVNERMLDTIPNEELLEICKQAQSIEDASGKQRDIELSRAINTLLEEIKKRGLQPHSKC